MDNKIEELIKRMLYEMEHNEIKDVIKRSNDPELLYIYAYNYNWDNGFEIPNSIINNDACELSTALLVFYEADGASYLSNGKQKNDNLIKWSDFVAKLYHMITDNKFMKGEIKFVPPLSKVQLFKLKKVLDASDYIFFEEIGNNDLNINI